MNLLLYDPELGSFLDKLVLLPNNKLKNLKFRNLNYENNDYTDDKNENSSTSDCSNKNVSDVKCNLLQNRKSQHKNCNKCYICKLELNLNEISHLICKLVKLGFRKLMVYLVLSDKKYLYSTITLNYVRCLYSRIIMNYEHYFNDLNIINHNKIDITILPLCNYQKLSFDNINVVRINLKDHTNCDLPLDNDNNYIHTDSKFMFNGFYNYILKLDDKHSKTNNNKEEKVESREDNEVLLDEFDCMTDHNTEIQNEDKQTHSNEKTNLLWLKLYDNVMFCGTFDYLHFGHKLLLLSAFLLFKNKLHIGVVASEELLYNKYNYRKIQPLETRKSYLKYYLSRLLNIYGSENLDYNTGTDSNKNSSNSNSKTNNNTNDTNLNNKFIRPNYKEDNVEDNEDKSKEHVQNMYRYTSIDFNIDTDSGFNSNKNSNNNSMDLKDDLNSDLYNFNMDNCNNIKIFDLFDVIGPSCELEDKFGLLLTPEIIHNGIEVNKLRKKLNLVPWDLIIVGLVCYQSESKLIKLSSSTIRKSIN